MFGSVLGLDSLKSFNQYIPMPRFKDTSPMTPVGRLRWVEVVSKVIGLRFRNKYIKGAAEHAGDLGHVSTARLLDEMEAEALDQLAYVNELRRRVTLEKRKVKQ